jgi:hypothetical protein
MAGNKYLSQNAGAITEVAAIQTSAGAGDAGKIPAVDSSGRFDTSFMPTGVAADTAAIVASEALSAGDLVNIWNNAGAFNVRKADASTSGKEAHGFVLAAVSSSATATVYFEGTNAAVSSLTAGVRFLSTTPGASTSTAPSSSGNIVQRVGEATAAASLNFHAGTPIVLA